MIRCDRNCFRENLNRSVMSLRHNGMPVLLKDLITRFISAVSSHLSWTVAGYVIDRNIKLHILAHDFVIRRPLVSFTNEAFSDWACQFLGQVIVLIFSIQRSLIYYWRRRSAGQNGGRYSRLEGDESPGEMSDDDGTETTRL